MSVFLQKKKTVKKCPSACKEDVLTNLHDVFMQNTDSGSANNC